MTKEEKYIENLTSLYSSEKNKMTEYYIKLAEKKLSEFGWKRLHDIPNIAGIQIECITRTGFIIKRYVKFNINGFHYIDGYDNILMWRHY